METILQLNEIESLYPDEWVLIGNPEIEDTQVLTGFVIHHNKDKKNVIEYAQSAIDNFDMVKIVFTGERPKISRLGIFKVIDNQ